MALNLRNMSLELGDCRLGGTQFVVMYLLREGRAYGLAINNKLRLWLKNPMRRSSATYGVLHRLEEMELVRSIRRDKQQTGKLNRRYYELTPRGQNVCARAAVLWSAIVSQGE